MKTKQKEDHEKYLKDKDLQVAAEKTKLEQIRAKSERDLVEQRRQAELDINDKILKIKEKEHQVAVLEMEQLAQSAKLEERKIKVEENKANNMKDLLAILKPKRPRSYHGAIYSRQCERSQLHLDIDPSTSSINITSDNDAVPSAINRYLFK